MCKSALTKERYRDVLVQQVSYCVIRDNRSISGWNSQLAIVLSTGLSIYTYTCVCVFCFSIVGDMFSTLTFVQKYVRPLTYVVVTIASLNTLLAQSPLPHTKDYINVTNTQNTLYSFCFCITMFVIHVTDYTAPL